MSKEEGGGNLRNPLTTYTTGEGGSKVHRPPVDLPQPGPQKNLGRNKPSPAESEAVPSGLKAPARECRGCGVEIPPQPHGPGRPREFCTRRCRRDFHHRREQAEIEHERVERERAARYELEKRWWGKRRADQLAKEREETRRRREISVTDRF